MTFEKLMFISNEIKESLKYTINTMNKYSEDIANLDPQDFTEEQIKLIEIENDELDELMTKITNY